MTRKALIQYRLSVGLLMVSLLCTACNTKQAMPTPTELPLIEPATTESTPTYQLLTLLAKISQDPIGQSDDYIYFNDYLAMEAAYNTTRPSNPKDYINTRNDEAYATWWVVRMYEDWLFTTYIDKLESMPEKVGFSLLDVDQAIEFSSVASKGLILAGNFNETAVSDAYQANLGMVPEDLKGETVWCWAEDCTNGGLPNFDNIMVENPFGGELGQRKPMTINNDLLMASADLELVLAHLGTVAGTLRSLADDPAYQAAVIAVSQNAYILQAIIANPTLAQRVANKPLIDDQLSPELRESAQEALLENFRELPPFKLLILADVVTENEQIARMGIVYEDVESAETAGSILLDRLANYPSFLLSRPFGEILTEMNISPRHYVKQEADLATLVLEFPTRKASSDEIAQMHDLSYQGSAILPGLVYRRFFDMFIADDTNWLSIITLEE